METKTRIKIISFLLMVIFALVISFSYYYFTEEKEDYPKKVDCYDNENNKIVGLECIEKRSMTKSEATFIIFIFIIVFASLIIGGLLDVIYYFIY